MNRRKFLGTLALAPLGFAFKNPFSGLFKRFCPHLHFDRINWDPHYDIVICSFCGYQTRSDKVYNWAKHWRVKDLHG